MNKDRLTFLIKAQDEVAKGLSAICATCQHYWDARAHNDASLFCAASNPCGGPLRGLDFPEYIGPLKEVFDKFCFVCGDEGTYGIRAQNCKSTRRFGICDRHGPMWAQSFRAEASIRLECSPRKGGVLSLVVVPPRKKTLAEVIQETEREWEKTDLERS